MAEQHKESSSADSKEKSSLLDDKIGKEFLSSWKSMSMADDDAMDFSFDTVPKGRKKTFDFDKLDMNFNLDDDFGKISSFKVDMSDLDFTCPPKNSPQSKDKKGESSGTKAGKQDGFNFSFDFNELDSFNLDSSSIKGDTSSNSNLRKKGVNTEGSDSEGPKKPKINDDESGHASNNSMAMKPPVSEKLETSKVDNVVGNLGSVTSGKGAFASKFSSSGIPDMPIEIQTSGISKTIRTKEMDEERDLPENTKSAESKLEQVITKAPSQPACQNDSEQDTVSEQHKKMFSSGTKVINVSGKKEKVADKATCVDSERVDLQSEQPSLALVTNSDSSVGEATNLGSSAEEVTNDPHKKNNDISFENISKNAFKKISCDNDVIENKKPALECYLASETRMMLMKDKELQGMQPNMSRRPEEKCFLKHLSSTAGTKGISFSSQKSCDMSPRESYRSNDTQIGSKLVRDSLPGSDKLNRDGLALNHSTDDLKSCSNGRESIVSDLMPSASKLAGNMHSFHDEVLKSKAIMLETGKSTKEVNMLSSQVNPSCLTEKIAKNTTQVSVKPKAEVLGKESSQKPRITSIEGNKISSFKTGKITHALSSLKALRNIGANMVLAAPLHQKEANSKVKSGQNTEIQSLTASKNDHLTTSGDNQKPQTRFLKRKATEVSEVDLTSLRSLKRLSQSPNNDRNFKKSSEEVVQQVESKPHNMIYNHPTLGLESPSDIKVMEVEISDSVLMEDNSNVEKAEAYMKELEDICNMLKKKREEAKELLVRAIVNDNNLLMLNHPIYEEKIWKVQKFASELKSKGIRP
ncbi:unnamed protein product [Lupinus luteus]|uniref:Uncharacterized protein n=1 Tax=Lupinus luteus TaxID=3873 RepID=A0AAV1WW55_LUPLU